MKIIFEHDGEASAFYNEQVVPLIRASGALAHTHLGDQVLQIAEGLGRFHQEHFVQPPPPPPLAAPDLRREPAAPDEPVIAPAEATIRVSARDRRKAAARRGLAPPG